MNSWLIKSLTGCKVSKKQRICHSKMLQMLFYMFHFRRKIHFLAISTYIFIIFATKIKQYYYKLHLLWENGFLSVWHFLVSLLPKLRSVSPNSSSREWYFKGTRSSPSGVRLMPENRSAYNSTRNHRPLLPMPTDNGVSTCRRWRLEDLMSWLLTVCSWQISWSVMYGCCQDSLTSTWQ